MSFLSNQVERMEELYGHPDQLSITIETSQSELNRIRDSMHHGRAHDVTMFIRKGDEYIFIAKPFYPPGLYRAPSGGVHRGEDFIAGAKREAMEETGVAIEIEKYIIRIKARFESASDHIDWTSHVFMARYLSGEINPIDTDEISEARLVRLEEIQKFREIMLASDRAGFKYRAFLTDEAVKRL